MLATLLALLAGLGIAVQTSVNLELRQRLGQPVLAALVSFVVGTLALGLLWLVTVRGAGRPLVGGAAGAPWWAWLGGLCGAYFVWSAIFATARLGPALFLGLVVAGQLVTSATIEHFGWFGVARHPISLVRVGGVLLLMAGLALMRAK
jgi:bacterial/archaeal transporter family-2 protein